MMARSYRIFSILFVLAVFLYLPLIWAGQKAAYSAAMQNNYGLATSVWRPLALLGYADAQFNLGLSYSKGRGIETDTSKALYWYRKAAENGEAPAQFNLAEHLRIGDGIERDYKQALFWFRKAAEQKYQSAQNNLGMMYAEGNGATKDLVEAAKWFNLAISNGSVSSVENLKKFEKEMSQEQITKAKELANQWLLARHK
jgi:TPR repeat protein